MEKSIICTGNSFQAKKLADNLGIEFYDKFSRPFDCEQHRKNVDFKAIYFLEQRRLGSNIKTLVEKSYLSENFDFIRIN